MYIYLTCTSDSDSKNKRSSWHIPRRRIHSRLTLGVIVLPWHWLSQHTISQS
ncbi:hypothetical protein RSAG8_02930, partial [Rhizoctonia solani AG-8 WAC10335]